MRGYSFLCYFEGSFFYFLENFLLELKVGWIICIFYKNGWDNYKI